MSGLYTVLDGLEEGITACSKEGRCLYLNPAAESLLGKPRLELIGRLLWEAFPTAAGLPLSQAFHRVARGGPPERLELRQSGSQRWLEVRLQREGETVWLFSSEQARLRKVEARLAAFEQLTEALAGARSQLEVADAVLTRGLEVFGAYGGLISLRDERGEYAELLHAHGYLPGQVEAFARLPLRAPMPLSEVLRTGQPILVESQDELLARYPALEPYRSQLRMRAMAVLPLAARGGVFGALVLSFSQAIRFADDDRAFILSLAHQCALALDRARLHDAERQARERLEAERTRLHALFQQAPALIALLQGPEHVYTLSNRLNDALLGRADIVGKPLREVLHDAADERYKALLDRIYQTGEPFLATELPVRLRQPDGTTREFFFNVNCQPTRDARGRIEGVAAFAFDVTELVHARQRAEALAWELRASETRFRAMADNAPVVLWVSDPTGACTYANKLWCEFTGRTEGEGLGRGWLDSIHPEDLERLERLFMDATARQASLRVEYRFRRADGQYRWVLESANPRFGPRGEFLGHVGSVTDITEHKQLEEERARLLRDARFLAEASATLASSLDYETTLATLARLAVPARADWCLVDLAQPDGRFKRVEVAHAFAEDAALAQQVRDQALKPEGNPHHPPTQALLEGRALLIPEFTPERIGASGHDETHAQVILAVQPRSLMSVPLVVRGKTLGVLTFITSRSGRQYTPEDLIFAEDLAQRAALSVDNARLYQEARRAVQLRDEFLSIASHELKTPLTPLSLKLQLLARDTEAQPDGPYVRRVREGIALSRRQIVKLSSLIGDLLDVSRIVAGRFKLNWQELDFSLLVRDVATRYEAQAVQAGSCLEVQVPDSVPGRWDALRLEQVVTNLVENAIKYGAGKPIRIHLAARDGEATLTVRDQGIGIAPENLSRIFERFERAVSDRHYGGLGLGLYITRSLLEAMGGTVEVESQPGKGATFTVRLPRAPG